MVFDRYRDNAWSGSGRFAKASWDNKAPLWPLHFAMQEGRGFRRLGFWSPWSTIPRQEPPAQGVLQQTVSAYVTTSSGSNVLKESVYGRSAKRLKWLRRSEKDGGLYMRRGSECTAPKVKWDLQVVLYSKRRQLLSHQRELPQEAYSNSPRPMFCQEI
jgi:hypothetical protein